jgi:hypothetical protein
MSLPDSTPQQHAAAVPGIKLSYLVIDLSLTLTEKYIFAECLHRIGRELTPICPPRLLRTFPLVCSIIITSEHKMSLLMQYVGSIIDVLFLLISLYCDTVPVHCFLIANHIALSYHRPLNINSSLKFSILNCFCIYSFFVVTWHMTVLSILIFSVYHWFKRAFLYYNFQQNANLSGLRAFTQRHHKFSSVPFPHLLKLSNYCNKVSGRD